MKPQDFDFYLAFLKRESGLVITQEKVYLLESRLLPVARRHQIPDMETLTARLRAAPAGSALHKDVVEAMTTNESSFFRDSKPFDKLKDFLLPHFKTANAATRKLRIWSAACSSGQEPYSIAMTIRELGAAFSGWTIEIVGTDLSTEILDQAQKGSYTQFEVQRGLPIQYLVKYFDQQGDRWVVKQDLKNLISFKQLNLLKDFSHLGVFDIVFCRNVLIYFDLSTKAQVLAAIRKQMNPNGILLLGGAETVLGISNEFKPFDEHRGLYIIPGSAHDAASAKSSSAAALKQKA